MIKKIMMIGIVAVVVIGLAAYGLSVEIPQDPKVVVTGDVIMPTKASRPGCEDDDTCYIPSVISVGPGDPVTWVNEDSAFHSVTSGSYDEPTDLFDSGYLDPLEPFTFNFDESGTYDYFCTLHPWMKGQVVVG